MFGNFYKSHGILVTQDAALGKFNYDDDEGERHLFGETMPEDSASKKRR